MRGACRLLSTHQNGYRATTPCRGARGSSSPAPNARCSWGSRTSGASRTSYVASPSALRLHDPPDRHRPLPSDAAVLLWVVLLVLRRIRHWTSAGNLGYQGQMVSSTSSLVQACGTQNNCSYIHTSFLGGLPCPLPAESCGLHSAPAAQLLLARGVA